MSLISIEDVRLELGDAYSTDPSDNIVQSFIDRQESFLKDHLGVDDLANCSYQTILKEYLIAEVCINVIKRDMIGSDSADSLDYTVGDVKESGKLNIEVKRDWVNRFKADAEKTLNDYFLKTFGFRSVKA